MYRNIVYSIGIVILRLWVRQRKSKQYEYKLYEDKVKRRFLGMTNSNPTPFVNPQQKIFDFQGCLTLLVFRRLENSVIDDIL